MLILGAHNTLDTDRKKILAISMMWGGMILYWFWESCLISYLIIPTKDFPFLSLEEFYTKTNLKVYSKYFEYSLQSVNISYILQISFSLCNSKQLLTMSGVPRDFFSRSNDTLKQNIWRERMEPYIDDDLSQVSKLAVFENL